MALLTVPVVVYDTTDTFVETATISSKPANNPFGVGKTLSPGFVYDVVPQPSTLRWG